MHSALVHNARMSKIDRPELAERLVAARKFAGFKTARAASARFGWNQHTYGAHESGQRGFSKDTAEVYAKAFKVPVAWLYLDQGEMSEPEQEHESFELLRQMPKYRDLVACLLKSIREHE
jgi:predicted phosphoadenosine phosphosulfate sulfurtransferase